MIFSCPFFVIWGRKKQKNGAKKDGDEHRLSCKSV